MGSSAVPVKKNPIKCERISSLARIVKSNLNVSLENIALWHERDLSNSANERFIIPMSSILVDDMISTMIKIISGLKINKEKIVNNIELTKGQIFAEFVLQVLVLKGIPRSKAYRDIQSVAFNAVEKHEHFFDALIREGEIINNVSKEELEVIFNPQSQLSASKNIIRNIVNKAKQMNIS
jgi:adenylosuccinate lyase